jgi:two-component system cell cycle sensor histidine kinase/response regulator CckA
VRRTRGTWSASTPDDRAHVGHAIATAVADRAAFAFGERILRPGGEVRHLRSWGNVSVGADGGLTMFGTCLDITELFQATEGRRRSEEWLDIALEGARIGLWEWSLASGAVTWSSNIDSILGAHGGAVASVDRSLEGYIGRVHLDDRARLREAVGSALREHVRDLEMTYRLLSEEGDESEPRWILARARIFRDEAGAPVRMAGSVVDVTDARHAAAERQKLVSLVEHATDFIAVTSFDGRLLFLNEAGRLLSGIARPEDVPRTLEELFPAAARASFREVELPAVVANGRWEGEGLLENRATGKPLDLDVTSFLVREQDSGAPLCVAAVRRDVTRHRELEEQLRHAQKMEAIGRLAAGVAHDFNNLLTIVGLTAGKLMADASLAPRAREDVLAIDDAGKRGSALTRQLLAFTRQQVLSPEVIDVDAIVTDMLTMFRRLLPAHLALESSITSDAGRVRADRGQIGQVLLNLVVNARDAMPGGGTLAVSTFREGPFVCIAGRDRGAGRSRDIQARLFEPFFTTKGPGKGSGLGLSTAHGIIEQSGGTIDVTSAPGRGSCFVVRLPRIEESVTPVPPQSPPPPRAAGLTETVLVVDDEVPLRRALGWALEDAGYQVHTTSDPAEALRILAREPVDLLLTDVLMPGMSGVELARLAHEMQPRLRVVFMSGYADDPSAARMKSGAAIFTKPFGADELARKVREVLDGTDRPSVV